MKSWPQILLVPAFILFGAFAIEVQITQDIQNQQQCSGMYSKKAWGGDVDPFIVTQFVKSEEGNGDDPIVGIVIYEWKDEGLIGVWPSDGATEKDWICNHQAVDAGFCKDAQFGEFLLEPNATTNSRNQIISGKVHLHDPKPINYTIKRTGYYCVASMTESDINYQAAVVFRNSYGELPASQIAKLHFVGGMTIAYAVIGVFWGFLYVQNRHDILPVQNYITAILILLIVETLMTWGFLDYLNIHGNNVIAKAMLIIVAVLNAGRNSFSFFLLLIVCMGYGVVKPSLGKTMVYVRFLAVGHFIFGVIYAIASLSITPENAGPIVLLVILPLAGTLTAFYVWTLNSLNLTMKDLLERKQNVKAMMYKKLWWTILASIIVIFGFFFLNSFTFAGRNDPNFVPDHWKTRWFVLDGWLNLVYFVDITYVAYLWRPTANNRRFAMSDELAQDDEGFEIASFGGSVDEEDNRTPDLHTPNENNAPLSPVPPKPVNDHHNARQSLDGETIFAVGEDADKWSEEGSTRDSAERARLTRKSD